MQAPRQILTLLTTAVTAIEKAQNRPLHAVHPDCKQALQNLKKCLTYPDTKLFIESCRVFITLMDSTIKNKQESTTCQELAKCLFAMRENFVIYYNKLHYEISGSVYPFLIDNWDDWERVDLYPLAKNPIIIFENDRLLSPVDKRVILELNSTWRQMIVYSQTYLIKFNEIIYQEKNFTNIDKLTILQIFINTCQNAKKLPFINKILQSDHATTHFNNLLGSGRNCGINIPKITIDHEPFLLPLFNNFVNGNDHGNITFEIQKIILAAPCFKNNLGVEVMNNGLSTAIEGSKRTLCMDHPRFLKTIAFLVHQLKDELKPEWILNCFRKEPDPIKKAIATHFTSNNRHLYFFHAVNQMPLTDDGRQEIKKSYVNSCLNASQ